MAERKGVALKKAPQIEQQNKSSNQLSRDVQNY